MPSTTRRLPTAFAPREGASLVEPRTPAATSGSRLLLAAALAASLLVYYPITRNYFFADDFVLFYDLANEGPLAFIVTPYGGHMKVARNVLFYLTARLFGTNPVPFYWMALLTHLVNVFLVFEVVRLVTDRPALACFGALLWGTSPLCQGALGWYDVHGQVLAGAAMLGILALYARALVAGRTLSRRALWLAYGLALFGSMCFGVGLGVALALPVVTVVLFPGLPRAERLLVFSIVVVIPALYAVTHALHAMLSTRPVPGGSFGPMLADWRAVLVLLFHLVAHGVHGLAVGFATHALLEGQRLTIALTAVFSLVVLAGVWRLSGGARRMLIGVTLFCLAVYGSIAAARAPMMSLFHAPNLATLAAIERYHYVGPACLAMMLCLALSALAPLVRPVAARALFAAWLATALLAYARSSWAVDHHDWARQETWRVLHGVRERVSAAPLGAAVYIPNQRFNGVGALFAQFPKLFPGSAGVFVAFFPHDVVDGRRVYFVENDREVVASLRAQPWTRIAGVLVAPEDAPAS